VNKIDWKATRINVLTSSALAAGRTPIHFPSDRECLEAIAPTVGRINADEITIGWLRNTLELDTIGLSENLLPQIRGNAMLEVDGPAREIEFDGAGNLAESLMPFERTSDIQCGSTA
jgi:hypothetical protein